MTVKEERTLLKNIREAIAEPRIKVVSFDVFDTLLVRPCINPSDLFYLVEQRIKNLDLGNISFHSMRIRAEKEARKKMQLLHPQFDEITLDEIYGTINNVFYIPDDICMKIKNIEISIEEQYLRPRKSLQCIYDFANLQNKKIIAISDMYLSSSIIYKLLNKNGYTHIERVFSSSDLRITKGKRGLLYSHALKHMNILPSEIVHIGDNVNSDFKIPSAMGITSFYVPKVSDKLSNSRINWKTWDDKINTIEPSMKLILGMIGNNIFDTIPRDGWDNNSYFNGNPYILGYYALGPFILTLMLWIIKNLQTSDRDIIAFIGRDGYLPIKVYQLLKPYFNNLPEATYLRISRQICYPFEVDNITSLIQSDNIVHHDRELSNRQVLELRLAMKIDSDFESFCTQNDIDLDEKCKDFIDLIFKITKYPGDILAGIRNFRKVASQYYITFFEKYKKIALFDTGYTARAQRILSQILSKDIIGYYIGSFEKIFDNDNLVYNNFLDAPFSRSYRQFHIQTALLEFFISEYNVGSAEGFDDNQNLICGKHSVDEKSIRLINSIQTGCIDFVKDILHLFMDDIKHINITPFGSCYLLNQFCYFPFKKDALMFRGIPFDNGNIRHTKFFIDKELNLSEWKHGYSVVNSNEQLPPIKKNIEFSCNKIYYKGIIIQKNLRSLRTIHSRDFCSAISFFCSKKPTNETLSKANDIARTKSKILAASVLLHESGGITRSKFSLGNKFICLFYYLFLN